ncbi:hypothetical protein P3W33_17365 [Luteibacter sp. PPL552]
MTHRFARRLIVTMGLGMIATSAFADARRAVGAWERTGGRLTALA